jgi:hypothetical protein
MTTIKLGISQEHAKLFPYVTRFFGVTSQGAPMHVVLLSIDMSFQTLNGVESQGVHFAEDNGTNQKQRRKSH